MITSKNYIGFEESREGKTTFRTFNPKLNTETDFQFTQATPTEVDLAVAKAKKAFGLYKNTSGAQRGAFLRAIAGEIENLGDELLQTYVAESGLPAGRAQGERGRTVGQLRLFAKVAEEGNWLGATIDTAQPGRQPLPKNDLRKMNVPLGPIVVFGASNFPLAFSTAGGDTASALAAGCPVIVKAHPMHTATSAMVASAVIKAAEKCDMPDGVFSHLNATDLSVGEQLVKHPDVKGVGFTGSMNGGLALAKIAGERKIPIPVFAEMGSINPVVILPNAISKKGEEWAKKYAGSINLGSGQFCTNPGLLVAIESSGLDVFANQLSQELTAQQATCMLHPKIAQAYAKGSRKMLDEAGVETLALELGNSGENFGNPAFVKVSGARFLENKNLHQEVFGPFSMLVVCKDEYEMAEILSGLEGQLTGTILAEADEAANYPEVVEALQSRVGRLIFNGVPTGVEVCPSMHHGGPFPATSDSRFTSVGTHAIKRWARPVAFQDWPAAMLPDALKDENPLKIIREVDGVFTHASV
ncbi:MAG: aldehyde dehydrogenase (NADP(+)) [Cytophagaceae bacterium]|nr:aldehyde dehydrogenase (NADP(+)) [Cytophagaceae bacterium]